MLRVALTFSGHKTITIWLLASRNTFTIPQVALRQGVPLRGTMACTWTIDEHRQRERLRGDLSSHWLGMSRHIRDLPGFRTNSRCPIQSHETQRVDGASIAGEYSILEVREGWLAVQCFYHQVVDCQCCHAPQAGGYPGCKMAPPLSLSFSLMFSAPMGGPADCCILPRSPMPS